MQATELGYLTWLPDSDPSIALAQTLHREKQDAIAMLSGDWQPHRTAKILCRRISIGFLICLLFPSTYAESASSGRIVLGKEIDSRLQSGREEPGYPHH
jgi:hypothetical protein